MASAWPLLDVLPGLCRPCCLASCRDFCQAGSLLVLAPETNSALLLVVLLSHLVGPVSLVAAGLVELAEAPELAAGDHFLLLLDSLGP